MGRGDAARRRRKNQEKALLLKGKAAALEQKQRAGKKTGDNDMSRSMKKLLQLKAAAEQRGKGNARRVEHKPGVARALGTAGQQGSEQPQRNQPQQQQDRQQQVVASHSSAGNQARAAGSRLADPFGQKKLKGKKKQFLKLKKLKKSGKLVAAAAAPGDKEAALVAAAAASRPAFGEQADAPLKVQLKRKHWAGEGGDQGKTSRRCTAIFERQMAAARDAAAAAAADDGFAAAKQVVSTKGSKKREQGGHQADEEVRQQLIEAYRQQKQARLAAAGRVPVTSATTQSLAALVRKGAAQQQPL